MAVLGEAEDQIGPRDGAERDHDLVAVERAGRGLHRPGDRVDPGDLLLDDPDAVLREARPRAASILDRADADERPQLAQAHPELRLPVDEHDVVAVAQQPLQLERGGDAAESAAEDERPAGHAVAARSSSSWRSSIRRILPVSVFGRSGTNSTSRGYA